MAAGDGKIKLTVPRSARLPYCAVRTFIGSIVVLLIAGNSFVVGNDGSLRNQYRCIGSCSPSYSDPDLACERVCSCATSESGCSTDTCPTSTVYCVLSDRERWQSTVINLQGLRPYKIMLAFSVVDENCNPPTINDPLSASQFLEDGRDPSNVESFHGFVTKAVEFRQLRLLLLVDQSKSIQDAQAQGELRASIQSFVDTMADVQGFSAVQVLIAGFDGRESLKHHTDNQFVSDKTLLDSYVQAADLDYSDPSTNLYGAWTAALDRLQREDEADPDAISVLVVFSDGADQAGFSSFSAVQARAAAATGPMFYAVTLEGEDGSEFEEFMASAGRNGRFLLSNVGVRAAALLSYAFVL